MLHLPILTLNLVAWAAGTSAQEARELWQWSTGSAIRMHAAIPSGDVFVSTEDSTLVLSADSGRIIWVRDDVVSCGAHRQVKGKPACRVNGENMGASFLGPYLRLESDERLLLVDLESGKDVFDTAVLGLDPVHGTCLLESARVLIAWAEREERPAMAAAFGLSEARTLWTGELPLSKKIRCLEDGAGAVWLAYGESDRGERRVFAIEATTGAPRWESRELAARDWEKVPVILGEADSTAVLHVDKSGPARIDLRTGALLWRSKIFEGDEPGGTVVRRANLILVTRDKELAAIEAGTGAVVWGAKKFRDPPVVLDTTRHGLLVVADGLRLIGYETGEPVWPDPVAFWGTAWLLRADTLFHILDRQLKAVALDRGVEREIGPVELDGDDAANLIEPLDDGLLVLSDQNAVAFDRDGRFRYHRNYRAPGLSLGEKVARTAGAVALTALSYHVATANARNQARGLAYIRGGSATVWYTYDVYIPRLDSRFISTSNSAAFAWFFTDMRDGGGREGFSLVRFDKRDGKEAGRLWSESRRPDYTIDPVSARVFMKTSDFRIGAYAFTS
jgi:outer membrane protein assembly factor BamB